MSLNRKDYYLINELMVELSEKQPTAKRRKEIAEHIMVKCQSVVGQLPKSPEYRNKKLTTFAEYLNERETFPKKVADAYIDQKYR